jgi:putative phosphoribosyl transferase
VLVAVPVGPPESVALLEREADEVICLQTPHDLVGVGRWYADFSAVSDEEVVALLGERAAEPER